MTDLSDKGSKGTLKKGISIEKTVAFLRGLATRIEAKEILVKDAFTSSSFDCEDDLETFFSLAFYENN